MYQGLRYSDYGGAMTTVSLNAPASPLLILKLLYEGANDLRATGFAGIAYGIVFVLMGYAIAVMYQQLWQMTMGLSAGFFLMGPFICCGIYELSRQHERGEKVRLSNSMLCWIRNWKSIAFFAAILTFLMIVWARVSVVLFALLAAHDYPDLKDMLHQLVSLDNLPFLMIWGCVGFVFAGLVFAMSVVAMPMMLDRGSDTIEAIATSAVALWNHRAAMLAWAMLITVLIGGSLLFFLPALAVTAPLVGHTTWRVYKALVAEDSAVFGEG
jgi:uncharacterized membrane protein